MKKAVLYVRVSTDEQAKLGYSLGHQEAVLSKFCEFKGYHVVTIYKEDHSAKNFDRPEFKKLLQYCKSNKRDVDYILVTKWDRFSRNQRDALQEIKRFSDMDIEINAAEQWIDFSIPHNKMMLSIYLTIPEIDNDVRGINTRMGMRRSLKEGRWTGGAPIGYSNERDHLKKPILIPDERAILVREAFELFATGLYDKQELKRIMSKKGLKLSKSQFPKLLENIIYSGKISVPAFKDEDAQIVQGLHESIVSEMLFDKVQRLLKSNQKQRKLYEKINDETPLRALLTCSRCGGKLTSSASKGRNQYYNYYHCRGKCPERIPAEHAHAALLNYFDNVAVKPEVAKLYLEVMGSIFKNNESDREQQIKKHKENAVHAEKKLASLEEKYILNEIERDSYSFMKPKFKEELQAAKSKIEELQGVETNYSKYLKSAVNLIQNLPIYYGKATVNNKQKLIGSIFPENLIIENGECRTTRENHVILALKGFTKDYKKEWPGNSKPFLYGRPRNTIIEPIY
jgi:DNA invertase Pin-like site-specific DNA recombinase